MSGVSVRETCIGGGGSELYEEERRMIMHVIHHHSFVRYPQVNISIY